MITVIIPTQNRLENLKKAILSVFKQTTVPLELIVVDDCSNEPVKMEVFKAAPSKTECRIVRLNKIRGANYARNIGIEKAQGKYIAMLDDDDLFLQIEDKSEPYNQDFLNIYLMGLLKSHLNKKEIDVLRLSYGLDCEKHSAKEIAKELDIEGSGAYVRVSQLKKQAVDKLIENVDHSQVLDYL